MTQKNCPAAIANFALAAGLIETLLKADILTMEAAADMVLTAERQLASGSRQVERDAAQFLARTMKPITG